MGCDKEPTSGQIARPPAIGWQGQNQNFLDHQVEGVVEALKIE